MPFGIFHLRPLDACDPPNLHQLKNATFRGDMFKLVNPAGVEPATSCTANKRSIHLSYGSGNLNRGNSTIFSDKKLAYKFLAIRIVCGPIVSLVGIKKFRGVVLLFIVSSIPLVLWLQYVGIATITTSAGTVVASLGKAVALSGIALYAVQYA